MAFLVSSTFTLPNSRVDQLSSLAHKQFFLHSFLPKKINYNSNVKSSVRVKSATVGNGLFTQTTPEVRRIVPEKIQNSPTIKIVYVVLEAQYQSSLSAAVRVLNGSKKYASFEVVGYFVEELHDESMYKTFCKDLKMLISLLGLYMYKTFCKDLKVNGCQLKNLQ